MPRADTLTRVEWHAPLADCSPAGDPLPRWLYYFFAASLVIYINLDCMDGKQARRTGTSNPLGQLFDHGCDALAIHLILDTVRTSTQLPAGWGAATLELAVGARNTRTHTHTHTETHEQSKEVRIDARLRARSAARLEEC